MPCSPSDNTINVNGGPGVSVPNIGIPFSQPQIPFPEINLPTKLIENLVELMQQLGALFPSSLFKANLDTGMKDVLDFIANILTQISPFLSLYKFFMAALQLIICVVEVLCSLPDPLAVALKLKKLFTECLPPFLAIFPWFALIAMILALLLLILALIQYIIAVLLGIIAQIIENIKILTKGLTLQDAESVLAAANKIASLLCGLENLLAVLVAIAAIVAIIQALAAIFGALVCSDEDDEGCCGPSICPSFIKNNRDITVTQGTLLYYSKLGPDMAGIGLPSTLTDLLGNSLTLRQERWQLFDTESNPEVPINLIITPTQATENFPSRIFFPDQEFTAETQSGSAPYTVDLTFELNPVTFHPSDSLGTRTFQVKDCIVVRKPRNGVVTQDNQTNFELSTGTFDLEGGLVYEEDGETPFIVAGKQATLNTFIHQDPSVTTFLPGSDDGYYLENVQFTWKINHPILAKYDLITVGCIPEVNIEKAVQNSVVTAEGFDSILARIPDLGNLSDDIATAQECLQSSINKFRADITTENAGVFQAEAETCLNDLADKVTNIYCQSLIAAVSAFKSTAELDTDVQFITRPISVTAILRDAGGTVISNNIPEDCANEVIDKLKAEATFGKVSKFEYDSTSGTFIAKLTSDSSGEGQLTVSFDNQIFSQLIPGEGFANPSSIEEVSLAYSFVDDITQGQVRRDETDVSGAE